MLIEDVLVLGRFRLKPAGQFAVVRTAGTEPCLRDSKADWTRQNGTKKSCNFFRPSPFLPSSAMSVSALGWGEKLSVEDLDAIACTKNR